MISVMIASFIINSILKVATKRERPSEIEEHSLKFHIGLQKYSFPSCHVQMGFTAVALVEKFYPPLFSLSLGLALTTSLARLLIGRHWVTDIVGGAAIGYIVGRLYIGLLI
jgi:undecaprenyl-diphosphatase